MTEKLYNLLAIFGIGTTLALIGVFSYLVLTEHLNAQRAELVAAVLRGELDEYDGAAPADAATTTQPARPEAPAPAGQRSAEAVRVARQTTHRQNVLLERTLRDIEARQRLLDQSLNHVLQEQEALSQSRAEWTQRQQQMTEEAQDVGMEKEVELVSGLPAKQAKAHVVNMWQQDKADAVRLILQLGERKATRILKEMKTPEEQLIMSELLEQCRTQEILGEANASGTTAGDAPP